MCVFHEAILMFFNEYATLIKIYDTKLHVLTEAHGHSFSLHLGIKTIFYMS